MISALIVAVLVVIGLILTLVMFKKQKEGPNKEPDYRAFFIMGISFLPMGIIFTATISPAFIGFVGMGISYMAIGLANRDNWDKKEE